MNNDPEQTPLPAEAQTEEAPADATEPTTLGSRLFNVFVAPGEAFESIQNRPTSKSNWLIPLALAIAMGILFSLVVFSQEDVLANLEQQRQTQIEKQVEAGRITQEQAEQQLQAQQSFMSATFMKIMGIVMSTVINLVWMMLVAGWTWLALAKGFKQELRFGKALEVAGLSHMISVLGGLVTMLLALMKANVQAAPTPAILLSEVDPSNVLHLILGSLNIFTLWYMVVLSIGISVLSGRTFLKSSLWIFIPWLVFKIAGIAFTLVMAQKGFV